MHILSIPSWYTGLELGNTGNFFRDQAASYHQNGHQSGVIAPHVTREATPNLLNLSVDFVDDGGIPTYRAKVRAFGPRFPGRNDWFWVRCGLKLYKEYISRHGVPDVIHAHCCLPAGFLAYTIYRQTGIPYVVTEHRTDYQEARHRGWQKRNIRFVLENASQRIVLCRHLGNLMVAQFYGAMRDWHVIAEPLSEAFYDCDVDRRNQQADKFTFINVAHLNGRKNHADILRAFAAEFRNDSTVQLKIAGNGQLAEYLHAFAHELGIGSQVEFTGLTPPESVRDLLEKANAFVLASTAETFGVVLIEALATGMPVIATDCGGPADIVDDSNGVLVPTGNVRALAEAMRTMRNNCSHYDRHQLKKDAVEKYNKDTFYRRILPVLKAAVERPLNSEA